LIARPAAKSKALRPDLRYGRGTGRKAVATRLAIETGAAERTRLSCWGDFALVDEKTGADLRPRGRKARALLAYLALHPGKAISREKLTGLLWSERAEEQARASLRQTLFELRGLANGRGVLEISREAVLLNGDALLTDMAELRSLAQAGEYEELLAVLPEADETFLRSCDGVDPGFDEWLRIERTRQHDALVALIADASARAVARGQVRAARNLHARLLEWTGGEPLAAPAPSFPPPSSAQGEQARGPELVAPLFGRRTLLAALAVPSAFAAAGIGTWWLTPRGDAAEGAARREAAGLYEAALPMIQGRTEADLRTAIDLLKRAVALDPGFAKGWAGLAVASAIGRPDDKTIAEAESHARRALRLDPNLAEAHGALGMILGFDSPEATAHLKRAIELNPRDPQTQFWISNHYSGLLDFGRQLNALRQVVSLDPQWALGSNIAATVAWELGHRDEARRYARRLLTIDRQQAFNCDYQLDIANGEYAAIVRKLAAVRNAVEKPIRADMKLASVLLTLGFVEPARLLMRLPDHEWQVASGGPIAAAAFIKVESSSRSEWMSSRYFLSAALQRLLNEGRAAEVVDRFDRGTGHVASLARADASRSNIAEFGPDVALALRRVGREQEARNLVGRADRVISETLARGPVPNWFQIWIAKLRIAQGRRDDAVAAIAAAVNQGWHYTPLTPLPDIGNIHAFRALSGDSRFEALRKQLSDHVASERRKVGSAPV
jgi:tetratricopeptide (TPR) repeat protein